MHGGRRASRTPVIRFLYGRPLETLLATYGLQPAPDPDRSLDLRRPERRRREPALARGRHRGLRGRGDSVQPSRRRSFHRRRRRLRVVHAPGYVARIAGSRRHAEPADGRLHGDCHAARGHLDVRARSRGRGSRRGCASRSSATSAPSSARATSSTRFWSSCSAASANCVGCVVARSRSGSSTRSSSHRRGRSRQDRGVGRRDPRHPEATARAVRSTRTRSWRARDPSVAAASKARRAATSEMWQCCVARRSVVAASLVRASSSRC